MADGAAALEGFRLIRWFRWVVDDPAPGGGAAGDEAVADAAGFGEARPVRWLRWIIEGAAGISDRGHQEASSSSRSWGRSTAAKVLAQSLMA